MSGDNDLIEGPIRWEWWRVLQGVWSQPDLDWLSGTHEEMASTYGTNSNMPMFHRKTDGIHIAVFSLKAPFLTYEELAVFKSCEELDKEHRDVIYDEWFEADGALNWLWLWEDVYPSSHLVYVQYGKVETHAIFCETYRDMLEVMQLVTWAK
jgi:hypothetical protein